MTVYAATLVRNRWLVAYTLVRNPSIQQYTAKNIELLKKDKEHAHVFTLEHTIKVHSEAEKKEALKEELGVEIKPGTEKQALKDKEQETVHAEEGQEPGSDVNYELLTN